MQNDIDKIVEWRNTWSMEITTEKFKVIRLGKQFSPKDYFVAEKN